MMTELNDRGVGVSANQNLSLDLCQRYPGEKVCRHCHHAKPVAAFPRNRRCRDGLSSWCRKCHNAAVRRTKARKYAQKGESYG
jgi:hypothetical protein